MKEWNKPELEELSVKFTEHGRNQTTHTDEVRPDPCDPNVNWYSYS